MLSCVAFAGSDGKVLAIRDYRGDLDRDAIVLFCDSVIRKKETENSPTVKRGDFTYFFIRQGGLHIVTATKANINAVMVFEYLKQVLKVLNSYFGGNATVEKVKENSTLIYAIMDEVMDYGYPQILQAEVLKEYILEKGMPEDVKALAALRERQKNLTLDVTGAVSWRKRGIVYKVNELYLDAIEKVSALLTPSGDMLYGSVVGVITMNTRLSGMPECKLGLNDKLLMGGEDGGTGQAAGNYNAKRDVSLDSLKFHQCVKLRNYETNKEVAFVPPDGEFELCNYRMTENIKVPFKVVPLYTQHGRTRAEMTVKIRGDFAMDLMAYKVVLTLPVPGTTSNVVPEVSGGKCKFDLSKSQVTWKLPEFGGGTEFQLKMEINMISTLNEKAWDKPPIKIAFNLPMYTSTGLRIRFLKVYEKSNYVPRKWVRYLTQAGDFEVRLP
mmetsp:Transcript_12390/g.45167  ORF Transcript_12390/g.45167 Transcript_12390/m.45167 type:complete len:440 (-) Transcript_12390:1427-2746(-)